MTPEIHRWVEAVNKEFDLSRCKRILEIGSLDVNGGVKHLFLGCETYVGVDQIAGKNVDIVCDAKNLPITEPFDLVICLEAFEHDPHFWKTLLNLQLHAFHKDSYFLISCPTTGFPEHRFPKDYYRFMPDAFSEVLMEGFYVLKVGTVKCPMGYPGIIALGKRVS